MGFLDSDNEDEDGQLSSGRKFLVKRQFPVGVWATFAVVLFAYHIVKGQEPFGSLFGWWTPLVTTILTGVVTAVWVASGCYEPASYFYLAPLGRQRGNVPTRPLYELKPEDMPTDRPLTAPPAVPEPAAFEQAARENPLVKLVEKLLEKVVQDFLLSWWDSVSVDNTDFVDDVLKVMKIALTQLASAGEPKANQILQRILKQLRNSLRNFRRSRSVVVSGLRSQAENVGGSGRKGQHDEMEERWLAELWKSQRLHVASISHPRTIAALFGSRGVAVLRAAAEKEKIQEWQDQHLTSLSRRDLILFASSADPDPPSHTSATENSSVGRDQASQKTKKKKDESRKTDAQLLEEARQAQRLLNAANRIEREYLRRYSDVLLKRILPKNEFESAMIRHFMRELTTQVILEPVAAFALPDEVNKILETLPAGADTDVDAIDVSFLEKVVQEEEVGSWKNDEDDYDLVDSAEDTTEDDEDKKQQNDDGDLSTDPGASDDGNFDNVAVDDAHGGIVALSPGGKRPLGMAANHDSDGETTRRRRISIAGDPLDCREAMPYDMVGGSAGSGEEGLVADGLENSSNRRSRSESGDANGFGRSGRAEVGDMDGSDATMASSLGSRHMEDMQGSGDATGGGDSGAEGRAMGVELGNESPGYSADVSSDNKETNSMAGSTLTLPDVTAAQDLPSLPPLALDTSPPLPTAVDEISKHAMEDGVARRDGTPSPSARATTSPVRSNTTMKKPTSLPSMPDPAANLTASSPPLTPTTPGGQLPAIQGDGRALATDSSMSFPKGGGGRIKRTASFGSVSSTVSAGSSVSNTPRQPFRPSHVVKEHYTLVQEVAKKLEFNARTFLHKLAPNNDGLRKEIAAQQRRAREHRLINKLADMQCAIRDVRVAAVSPLGDDGTGSPEAMVFNLEVESETRTWSLTRSCAEFYRLDMQLEKQFGGPDFPYEVMPRKKKTWQPLDEWQKHHCRHLSHFLGAVMNQAPEKHCWELLCFVVPDLIMADFMRAEENLNHSKLNSLPWSPESTSPVKPLAIKSPVLLQQNEQQQQQSNGTAGDINASQTSPTSSSQSPRVQEPPPPLALPTPSSSATKLQAGKEAGEDERSASTHAVARQRSEADPRPSDIDGAGHGSHTGSNHSTSVRTKGVSRTGDGLGGGRRGVRGGTLVQVAAEAQVAINEKVAAGGGTDMVLPRRRGGGQNFQGGRTAGRRSSEERKLRRRNSVYHSAKLHNQAPGNVTDLPGMAVFGKLPKPPVTIFGSTNVRGYTGAEKGRGNRARARQGTPLSETLYHLLDELFEFEARSSGWRTKIYPPLLAILRLLFSGIVDKVLAHHLHGAVTESAPVAIFQGLIDSMWPPETGGVYYSMVEGYEDPPMQTPSKAREARREGRRRFMSVFPSKAQLLVGKSNSQHTLEKLFEIFQQRALLKSILYGILDQVVGTMFPETEVDIELIHRDIKEDLDRRFGAPIA